MADNVSITAGSGTAIATDDVGGAHYQRIKLVDATDGSSTAVGTLAAPLRVEPAPLPASTSLTGNANATWGTDIDCRGYTFAVLRVESSPGSPTIEAVGAAVSGGTYNMNLEWINPDSVNGTGASRFFAPGTGHRFAYLATVPPFLKIQAVFGGSASAVTATLDLYQTAPPVTLAAQADLRIYVTDSISGSSTVLRGTRMENGTGGRLFVAPGVKETTLLNAVTGTGAGSEHSLDTAYSKHALQVSHTGGPTAVIVVLQGSLDGTNWVTLVTWDEATVNSGDIVWVVDKPVSRIRANLTTLTGGSSPTVTAKWVATP